MPSILEMRKDASSSGNERGCLLLQVVAKSAKAKKAEVLELERLLERYISLSNCLSPQAPYCLDMVSVTNWVVRSYDISSVGLAFQSLCSRTAHRIWMCPWPSDFCNSATVEKIVETSQCSLRAGRTSVRIHILS